MNSIFLTADGFQLLLRVAFIVGILFPIDGAAQVIPLESGPKPILTIHGTAGWEYTLLKYGSYTNIHGVQHDYLPWHVYLAQTNGDVDMIDVNAHPNQAFYASRSVRIWDSGSPYRQPETNIRQGFLLSANCETQFIYRVWTNANINSTSWDLWRTFSVPTNGVVRLMDENYGSRVPWLDGTAEPSRFYLFEARSSGTPASSSNLLHEQKTN